MPSATLRASSPSRASKRAFTTCALAKCRGGAGRRPVPLLRFVFEAARRPRPNSRCSKDPPSGRGDRRHNHSTSPRRLGLRSGAGSIPSQETPATRASSDERGQFTFFVPPGEHFVSPAHTGYGHEGQPARNATVTVLEEGKVPPDPPRRTRPGTPFTSSSWKGGINHKNKRRAIETDPSSSSTRRVVPEGRTVIGKVLDAEGGPLVGATIAARVVTEQQLQHRLVLWSATAREPSSRRVFLAAKSP